MRFPSAQTLWKSVKIRQSYRQFKGGNFFETQCSIMATFTSVYCITVNIRVTWL